MKISGQVVDGNTMEPLPGASLVITDQFYKPFNQGAAADDNGNFTLDSELLDNSNNRVLIGYVDNDYEQAILSPGQANGQIKLIPRRDVEEATVFVTAIRRIKQLKKNFTWYYAAVGVTGITAVYLIYRVVK